MVSEPSKVLDLLWDSLRLHFSYNDIFARKMVFNTNPHCLYQTVKFCTNLYKHCFICTDYIRKLSSFLSIVFLSSRL